MDDWIEEYPGVRVMAPRSHAARRTPHAARRTPHAARRTPHAARRTPHAARRTAATRAPHPHRRPPAHAAPPPDGLPRRRSGTVALTVSPAPDTPTERRGSSPELSPHARRLLVVALLAVVPLVAVVALVAAGELTVTPAGPAGLTDPGVVTRWGLPVARALHDAAATMTIGLLALAVVALPRTSEPDRDLLGPHQVRAVRLAARWAAAWGALALGVLLLTYSDVVGVGLGSPGALDRLATFVADVKAGRLLTGTVVLVVAVIIGTLTAGRVSTLAVLALVSLGALLPARLWAGTPRAPRATTPQ